MRADALRNREKLVLAAQRVFASNGPEAPLEEVATAAKVTRTTLHRHFPTRGDLVAEVYARSVETIEDQAGKMLDRDDGIVVMVDAILDKQFDEHAIGSIVGVVDFRTLVTFSERTALALTPLVDRGRRAGLVHEDVQVDDVMLVFPMAQGVMSDSNLAGREFAQARLRLLIHRALFAPAGWGRRD